MHIKPITGAVRLTPAQMRLRDWAMLSRALSHTLPELEQCNEFERALLFYVWGDGWLKLDGSLSTDGRKYVRLIWRALGNGPFRAGSFAIERSGRWELSIVLDPHYAMERKARFLGRRLHRANSLDSAFEADLERRWKARKVRR